MLRDLVCPVCKARGVPIFSAAWLLSSATESDTACRACGAFVRFPVAARPVGWLLIVPCMALIGAEVYAVPVLAFLLVPLTLAALVLVPPYAWRLRPVLREGGVEGARGGDRVCPACHQPGVPRARVVWELWVTCGRTRCTRCAAPLRLSFGAHALAFALFGAALYGVLLAWLYLPNPLAIPLTVALPVSWLTLPPRFFRLRTAPETAG